MNLNIPELEEIEVLIKASYPLIYIVSNEEQRVLRMLDSLLPSFYRPKTEITPELITWSSVSGFKLYDNGEEKELAKDITDPFQCLEYINDYKKSSIFVLCDYHYFLNDNNYDVIRYLRELTVKLKHESKNVIILSPILRIPDCLDKEITVIDYPLPSTKEIRNIVNSIKKRAKDRQNIEIKSNGESTVKALMGLTTDEIENVLYKSLAKTKKFSINVIIKEKEQIIKKGGILEFYQAEENLKDVGGLDIFKQWIKQRNKSFTEKARKFGIPNPKGILLIGIPGCGKSLSCKVISNIWKFPLLRFDIGSVFSGIVGSSEDNIRKAIKLAESISPCILWIDEIEKAFSGVKSSNFSDSGTTARVFGTFLTWMQEKKKPVFVVATANDISTLPREFLRKGRFDEIFFIDLPNEIERKEIFKIHITKRKRNIQRFDLDKLVEVSEGYSGAEIEGSIISALYDAFDDDKELTTDYIIDNIKKMIPLAKTMEEQIKELRNWSETKARKGSSDIKIAKTKEREVMI